MSALFGIQHIAQLHEIQQARLRRNQPGIGHEVQDIIRRLTDHGVVVIDGNLRAAREAQAKRYWDAGIARNLGYKNLKAYLEDVPAAPDLGISNVTMMHPWLLLIEPRIGFEKLCASAKVDCRMDWVVCRNGDAPEGDKPFWVAFNNGRRHRGCTIRRHIETSGSFNDHGFTAFIGVCAVLQKRDLVGEGVGDLHDPYHMYLIGSRNDSADGIHYANLQSTGDQLQIWESPYDQACAAYGCPSYVRH